MFSRIVASALLLAPAAHAFFIIGLDGSRTLQRLDPIVNKGEVSPHMHVIAGSNAFGPEITTDSLHSGTCTTGPVTGDMSSYWASQMYHRNSNSTYSAVPHLFSNAYYLRRGGPNYKDADVKAFPKDFRMLAGDPKRTTYNASKHEDVAVSYVCLDYTQSIVQPPQATFPTLTCKDGVRAQVVFPSCWDGKNVDSTDHKSHMAYPIDAVDSGDCPTSHPVKLVTLFYEFVFDVNKWSDRGEDAFVWASGFGQNSFHADFYNGWKDGLLQDALDQCGDRSDIFNDVEKCAPLAPYVDRKAQAACKIPVMVEESTGLDAPVATIPGCNQDVLTKKVSKCNGAVPAIKGFSPATTGSGSSSAVSASSTSSSAAAETYSSAPAVSSSSPVSASTSAVATSSGAASVSVPGGNLAVSTPVATATPTAAATATTLATVQPAPTKVCKRSTRAADALSTKHKRAVKNHVRRSLNRLSAAH